MDDQEIYCTLPQGVLISSPKPDHPHSKLSGATRGYVFPGEVIWDALLPITAAESTLRSFDFPIGLVN
jgi:hypothetical protein